MSEFTKLGGYLIEGQPEVAHDNTLSGNGLEGSPLGLSEQVSEVNDLVHSNSGTWNGVSTKLDTTAFSDVSGSFLTAVPTGTMNESAFGYDSDNKISSYNGSAIGGSAPTYEYIDNGLIKSIDTSGLYATSAGIAANAKHLNEGGTMGGNIVQTSGSNSFYYMPLFSPWTTADVATGIFAPLQYTTGACLGMQSNNFRAYFKGNEWFVSNRGIGQALRGEVHGSRGVHISGATIAGYGFDLNIKAISGVNSTGSWKYGHAEDAALRAVSSCDMHESAFSYDASNNITAYNGSAFAGGGSEFPQSATEAIETVTANSADWNGTTETVSSNSGAWGGSALPISAGPGIKFEMVNDTLVASTDETVLYTGNTSVTAFTASEPFTNFREVAFYVAPNYETTVSKVVLPMVGYNTSHLALTYHSIWDGFKGGIQISTEYTNTGMSAFQVTSGAWFGWANDAAKTGTYLDAFIYKIIGINRIAGGN